MLETPRRFGTFGEYALDSWYILDDFVGTKAILYLLNLDDFSTYPFDRSIVQLDFSQAQIHAFRNPLAIALAIPALGRVIGQKVFAPPERTPPLIPYFHVQYPALGARMAKYIQVTAFV